MKLIFNCNISVLFMCGCLNYKNNCWRQHRKKKAHNKPDSHADDAVHNKQLQQVIYLCNDYLFARSSNWRSKWAGVSLFRLGVKIWPPRLNSLSTGALEGNALFKCVVLQKRTLNRRKFMHRFSVWKCQSSIRQLGSQNVTSNNLRKLLLLLFKSMAN